MLNAKRKLAPLWSLIAIVFAVGTAFAAGPATAPAAPGTGATVREPVKRPAPQQPAWKVGDTWTNTLGMKFAYIPAGEFDMGSPSTEKDHENDETLHHVKLTRPFLMARTHVTVGQFKAFVADTNYQTEAEKNGVSTVWTGEKLAKGNGACWRNPGFPQGDDHPVLVVSWNDAVEYCKWLSKKENRHYRLPTEAEYEYACRAGTKTAFPWGDDPDDGAGWANCWDQSAREKFASAKNVFNWTDGFIFTSPAKKFRANAFGLYDMIGNAWEWCSDYYAPYPPGDAVDPTGPATGDKDSSRVLRGGAWYVDPRSCRAAYRYRSTPDSRVNLIGFRFCLGL